MPNQLNLTFPTSWQECTLQQLEQVASVIIDVTERSDRFHPFKMEEVKLALFFLMSGMVIKEGPFVENGETSYLVTHPSIKEPFMLDMWKVSYWIEGEIDPETINDKDGPQKDVPGVFDWLDGHGHLGPILFPYPKISLKKKSLLPVTKTFAGVQPLMQDFSWQRYRLCIDWMEEYVRRENIRVKLMQKAKGCPSHSISIVKAQQARKDMEYARAEFLSVLLTGSSKDKSYFLNIGDKRWQVILFWWSEQMLHLHKQFPRCFKESPIKGKKKSNPFELYTRTIATMEKYLGLDEDKVNNQTYTLVLQHMEDMAKENEEVEKMKRKQKK